MPTPNWSRRGHDFQAAELTRWLETWDKLEDERRVELLSGRFGRIDIALDERDGSVAIIETKATDWDAMAERRVTPNVRRHVRQVMKYVEHFWARGIDTHPALVYPTAPSSVERRAHIAALLEDAFVQVAWRDED